MKKILAVTALLTSIMAFAGPKNDMEKADKLLKENKIGEAVKLLKTTKAAKGEEAEYEAINYFLAQNASTIEEQTMYLKKVSDNTASKTPVAVNADINLFNSANSIAEKIKYVKRAAERSAYTVPEIDALLAALYKSDNKESLYKDVVAKSEKAADKDVFKLSLAKNIISLNEKEAVSLLAETTKSSNKEVKVAAYYELGAYYLSKKDNSNAEKMFRSAKNLDPKNENLALLIAQTYFNASNYEKALKEINDVKKINSKNENAKLLEMYLQYLNKKDSEGDKLFAELVKAEPNSHDGMITSLYNLGLNAKAEQLASKYKKNLSLLATIQANNGKIDEAIKTAESAVKAKENGAAALLKQLKELKAKAK